MNIIETPTAYSFADVENPSGFLIEFLTTAKATYYFTIDAVNTATFEAKPDVLKKAEISINKIISDYLSNELPDFSSNSVLNKVSQKALKQYTFHCLQGVDAYNTFSGYCLNGGLNLQEFSGNSFFDSNIIFLTKQPQKKVISRNQKEYISIIPKVGSANILLDGVVKTNIALTPNQINIIDVSPALMGVGANAKSYNVSIQGSSYIQTYELAKPTQYQQKYFVFLNSLGVFETALLRGLKESQNERSDKTANINIKKNYDKHKGKGFVISVEKNEKFKVNSGYLKKTMLDYYANELFFSKEIYEYLSPTDYRQIRITSKTVLESTENIDLVSLNFDCEYL